jgi:DNA-binding NtrC family response regulator
MKDLAETTVLCDAAIRRVNGEKPEFALDLKRRKDAVTLKGLVVSSDDQVRRRLAEILWQCGLAAVFASTVAESALVLSAHNVFLVLCQDCMADGRYEDIAVMADQASKKVPVIVVSRTGDWPEYLTAIRAGAFDYVAYPPILGDLERAIENALGEYPSSERFAGIQIP